MLTLSEYGELNLTKLISYCGLNMKIHKGILDDMEQKGLLSSTKEPWGSRAIIKYRLTQKGSDFYKTILEPYENMFPRGSKRQ